MDQLTVLPNFESSPIGNVWDKHEFMVKCFCFFFFSLDAVLSPLSIIYTLFFSQVCFDQNCIFFFHIRKPSHWFWKSTCIPQLHNFPLQMLWFVVRMHTSVICFVLYQSGSFLFHFLSILSCFPHNYLVNVLSVIEGEGCIVWHEFWTFWTLKSYKLCI